jgi:RNA polymerase sigma factor (sigma-70 family)
MGKQTPRTPGPICRLTTDSIGDKFEDEDRILRLYLKGDADAFWSLWALYRGHLFGICLKQMGGVREDAEDALSLAMLKARDRLPTHASKIINLKAWLTRMTRNLCVDLHRERRRRVKNIERIDDMSAADHMSVALAVESPEQTVLHREMNICVQRAFNDLPPRLRAPMMLHSFQAMPYRDIAAQLMLTNENVRKRIQHARLFLHERLKIYRSGMGASEPRALKARGSHGSSGDRDIVTLSLIRTGTKWHTISRASDSSSSCS